MATQTKPVYWLGGEPHVDDMGNKITTTFIDGRTSSGPWAIMTPEAHAYHGVGLGMGKGQRYQKQPDGRWLKVEG